MKNLKENFYYFILEMSRQPMYVISTIFFPSMFFWFFGVPNAKSESSALMLTASFSIFGAIGVSFFQTAVFVAQEKKTPWSAFLRVIPMHRMSLLVSRILGFLIFSILSASLVWLIAAYTTPLIIKTDLLLKFAGILILGSIPFSLMGIYLGLTISATAILPVVNLIYLPMSFAGGLWIPANELSPIVQKISLYLPTRMLGEISWALLFEKPLPQKDIYSLFVYTALFASLSHRAYKRLKNQTRLV